MNKQDIIFLFNLVQNSTFPGTQSEYVAELKSKLENVIRAYDQHIQSQTAQAAQAAALTQEEVENTEISK